MDFKQHYEKAETTVKLEFLYAILMKNEGLRNQFIEYCKPVEMIRKNQEKNKDEEKMISGACIKLKKVLETLNFDNLDWRLYTKKF